MRRRPVSRVHIVTRSVLATLCAGVLSASVAGAGSSAAPLRRAAWRGSTVSADLISQLELAAVLRGDESPLLEYGDEFGRALASDGTRLAVGAPASDREGRDVGAVLVYWWSGSGWLLEAVLSPPDAEENAGFGTAVAIDGDTLVVGAPSSSALGNFVGRAFVFHFDGSTWAAQATLQPDQPVNSQQFGASVGVSGQRVAIGSPRDEAGRGAVTIYVPGADGWVVDEKLIAPAEAGVARFGTALDLRGSMLLVGAPHGLNQGQGTGTAYLYQTTGGSWGSPVALVPAPGETSGSFGAAVALGDSYAVVGAPTTAATGTNSGALWVFAGSDGAWSEETRLTPPDGTYQLGLGASLAIDGDLVISGVTQAAATGPVAGGALVFARSGGAWSLVGPLAITRSALAGRETAVAAAGGRVVIGATSEYLPGILGTAHSFERQGTSFTGEQVLTSVGSGTTRFLGTAAAVEGDTLAVGAPGTDGQAGTQVGAVHVYRDLGSGWAHEATLVASDGKAADQLGTSVAISGDTRRHRKLARGRPRGDRQRQCPGLRALGHDLDPAGHPAGLGPGDVRLLRLWCGARRRRAPGRFPGRQYGLRLRPLGIDLERGPEARALPAPGSRLLLLAGRDLGRPRRGGRPPRP